MLRLKNNPLVPERLHFSLLSRALETALALDEPGTSSILAPI